MQDYSFELITGPMSCGKTEELLRRVRRGIIAKKKVKVISPDIDTRTQGDYIESRNGLWSRCDKSSNRRTNSCVIKKDDEIIAIDDFNSFDEHIIKVITKLMEMGKKVIGTGFGLRFQIRAVWLYCRKLLCLASKVE